jgi:hypothetical protein
MAARLIVLEGMSSYRALCRAGYASSTARVFGRLLRGAWGLREAIRLIQEQEQRYLVPRPARRRTRYDRRPLALNVRQYVTADLQMAATNTTLRRLHTNGRRAQAIAESRHVLPERCSLCSGLTEGRITGAPAANEL